MDNESEVIRQEMEETRTALQDKLETLEQQVKETISSASEAVADTVETVKEAVHDTVDSVKETFDLRQQVEKHPWEMFLGAAVVGFLGGHLLHRALTPRAVAFVPPPFSPSYNAPLMQGNGPAVPPPAPKRSVLEEVAETYQDELTKLKGLAISTVGGLVREMLSQSAPPPMVEQIRDVVDSVTTKLGGHPFDEPIINLSPDTSEWQRDTSGNGRHQKIAS
jgi:ElaB/YqjD/DUF883 family membrane-anchored ribosome-binding protein